MTERYVVVERLAVGGMGEVFLARQQGLGGFARTVVIKRLLSDADDDSEATHRLLDEARVVGSLSHENVVQVIEVGEERGSPFIAMEYIHGESGATLLRRAAKAHKPVPLLVAAQIVRDVARGLQHAHDAKDAMGTPLHIVHRDIAPKNLLVRHDGVTKVVDFGIARSEQKLSHTATGAVAGTLSYMSPEQAANDPIGPASDQWALGVVLWEMLVGKRLFRGEGPAETLDRIFSAVVERPSKRRPEVPKAVDAIALRMLRRPVDERFPRLGDVATALEAAVAGCGTDDGRAAVAAFVDALCGDELALRAERLKDPLPTQGPPGIPPELLDGRTIAPGVNVAGIALQDATLPARGRVRHGDDSGDLGSARSSPSADAEGRGATRESPGNALGDVGSDVESDVPSATPPTRSADPTIADARPPAALARAAPSSSSASASAERGALALRPRRGRLLAAVAGGSVLAAGLAFAALRPSTTAWSSTTAPASLSTTERTRLYLREAREWHPITFTEAFVSGAQEAGVAADTAELVARKLVAVMGERFALLVRFYDGDDDARRVGAAVLKQQERALEDRARALLRPLPAAFAEQALEMWAWDTQAPARWLPPSSIADTAAEIRDGGVAFMKDTAARRRATVDGILARAGVNAAAVHAVLDPFVQRREALLEEFATAPAAKLEAIDDEMDRQRELARDALLPLLGPTRTAALIVVAFVQMPDPDEFHPFFEDLPSERAEKKAELVSAGR
jgi:serine/threonine-protein kinase